MKNPLQLVNKSVFNGLVQLVPEGAFCMVLFNWSFRFLQCVFRRKDKLVIPLNFSVEPLKSTFHLFHPLEKLRALLQQNLFSRLGCRVALLKQRNIFDERLHLDPCAAHAFDKLHPTAVDLRIISDAARRSLDSGDQPNALIIAERIGGVRSYCLLTSAIVILHPSFF